MDPNSRIPVEGMAPDKLLEAMAGFRSDDANWADGRTWSLVYYAGDEHHDFLKKAHNLYFAENGLNPMAFKSLKRMEAEVVRMSGDLLNGDEETVGTMTSGGTESILMAVKAARDRAKKTKPWIRNPEIVVPRTIHVAFDKAAHYFGLKIRYAPVGDDYRASPKAIKRLVNRNTVLIAASAPQYPHGVVDPIEELAAFAARKKIPFHVDACIGGFMLPWVEKLGHEVPTWDFRVPGVTSISADLHKYAYAAKGASVILYRDMSYLKHQFFVSTDWPGGIYASPSMGGTRPGGCISAAWAALMGMGASGYMTRAEGAMKVARRMREGIAAIDGISICGNPHMTIATFQGSEGVDIFVVADLLEKKGWTVDRQQYPSSIHCTCNANQTEAVEEYLLDLAATVETARAHPELSSEGDAPMYGMMAKVPFRGLVRHSVMKVMEGMYAPDGADPDLSSLGSGDDDGFILKAINKYGDRAMAALDKLEALRNTFRKG